MMCPPLGALVGQEPPALGAGCYQSRDMAPSPSLHDEVPSRFLCSLALRGENEPLNSYQCLGSSKTTPKDPHFGVRWVLGGWRQAVWERLKLQLL